MKIDVYIIVIICIIACLLFLGFTLYIFAIKRELRNLKNELTATRKWDYNRQLTVSLFDEDMTSLTSEMNKNLDYQKQLKLEAEQSELQLKQSVSDIAHDLRTPLTVIKGNLQMLTNEENLSDKGREYLDICLNKSDTLKNMVDNFFDMSVLESDRTTVDLQKVNVTNMLMQFLIDNEAVIRGHGLTPRIELSEKSIFILADEQMLIRMLSNLLNNILKYAKDSFGIKLELLEENQCRITFENTIAKENSFDVEHLFDRSYRGDMSRHGSGAGLGLYIVKLLAEKQQASVEAKQIGDKLSIYVIYNWL
jgi:signal transduction histidine kinase